MSTGELGSRDHLLAKKKRAVYGCGSNSIGGDFEPVI